jgi:hypothetical protein
MLNIQPHHVVEIVGITILWICAIYTGFSPASLDSCLKENSHKRKVYPTYLHLVKKQSIDKTNHTQNR